MRALHALARSGALCMALAAAGPWSAARATEADELVQAGSVVFATRCSVCHGKNADGQSELARIMNPRPANLRASRLDAAARHQIVHHGGASVGRSPNMPAWEGELSEDELRRVIAFVASVAGTSP